MFQEEYGAVGNAANAKVMLLKKKPGGYFLLSVLAGMYIGFGILLIFSIGGMLSDQPYAKIIMGLSFGIALSLVVIAGAELFTGNNLMMVGGVIQKTIKIKDAILLWIVCYIGNWVGSILLAYIFHLTGLNTGAIGEFIATSAMTKMSLSFTALFTRAILCNILVCLAVWCGIKCKTESGKLIMIFWCLFAFITTGFEHSIANMTLLTISMLDPFGQSVTMAGYMHNLLAVTFGNMVGGILFVAIPYYFVSREKK